MIKTSEFQLIYDLLDNIILLDDKSRVIFQGEKLGHLLSDASIDAGCLHSEIAVSKQFAGPLSLSVNESISTSETISIQFPRIDEEFILLPITSNDFSLIVLSQKDKLSQLSEMEFNLRERGKELRCLYNISREMESAPSLDELFNRCLVHIKNGFQFPEESSVRLEVGKKTYGRKDSNNALVEEVISSPINVGGKKSGELKIFISNEKGFLPEEIELIDEIANKFARAIEESQKTVNLEKQQKILLNKNEALLKITNECNKRREKLRTFFSAITDKIVVIDREFTITMSNKEEIGDEGKCYKKLFNLDKQCEKCPAVKTFETADHFAYEREVDDKYLMLRSYPIFNQEQQVERVLEVCHDITVQKKMEIQLLQSYKLASLGKLVAGVAHEINNPNTFILGNLKIIQEAFQDIFPILEERYQKDKNLKIARLNYDMFKDNITTLVDDMINGANRTKKIVGDLRNFAKKDDGMLTEDVDLNYIIKNNLTLTRKHVKKYAELDIELADNIPVFTGNSNKLEQVMLNLVMNAAESIERENGHVKIKTEFDEKISEVVLVVEDNGCGMDETTLKNIFDPFFTTKRNKGGTGLGLSITYGIIKDHHGAIDVESKPGVGTKFTIRFPVKSDKK